MIKVGSCEEPALPHSARQGGLHWPVNVGPGCCTTVAHARERSAAAHLAMEPNTKGDLDTMLSTALPQLTLDTVAPPHPPLAPPGGHRAQDQGLTRRALDRSDLALP